MQAILKHCMAILNRFIFIGFSVQIVLGILWMCNAFVGFNGPGEGIVCVGAVLLLGGALWFVQSSIYQKDKKWKDIFMLLSVMTFPFVMQSLVKPDVRLVMTAVVLFLIGGMCRVLNKCRQSGTKKKLVGLICGFWFLVMGLLVGTDVCQNGWTPLSTRLTERFVWTTLYDTYAASSQETRDLVNYHKMVESTYEATGMRECLIPLLEENLGEEKTGAVLEEFRSTAWQINKKQIVKEIFWDVTGYGVSPLIVQLQLGGRAYDSYTGMNYRELLLPAPRLGKIYTNYSCWWFVIALAVVSVVYLLRLLMHKRRPVVGPWIVAVISCVSMVVYYVLDGAGRMDYKNTLLVLCIWLLWMAGGVRDAKN